MGLDFYILKPLLKKIIFYQTTFMLSNISYTFLYFYILKLLLCISISFLELIYTFHICYSYILVKILFYFQTFLMCFKAILHFFIFKLYIYISLLEERKIKVYIEERSMKIAKKIKEIHLLRHIFPLSFHIALRTTKFSTRKVIKRYIFSYVF